ncbi:hypothetical protein [Candidatus Pyrohabitans sp.]
MEAGRVRIRLAVLGILLLGILLPGCTSKPEERVGVNPPPVEEEVYEPLTSEVEDAEIDTLFQEVQELEEFLDEMEQGDSLELSL